MANNQKATLHQMWLPEDLEHLMFSIKWHQFICNDKVRKQTGQPEFTAIVQPRRLTLFGHIWMITQMPLRILSTFSPEDWRRPWGCPCITWLSTIQQDLRSHDLTLPEAMDMAQNRSFVEDVFDIRHYAIFCCMLEMTMTNFQLAKSHSFQQKVIPAYLTRQ